MSLQSAFCYCFTTKTSNKDDQKGPQMCFKSASKVHQHCFQKCAQQLRHVACVYAKVIHPQTAHRHIRGPLTDTGQAQKRHSEETGQAQRRHRENTGQTQTRQRPDTGQTQKTQRRHRGDTEERQRGTARDSERQQETTRDSETRPRPASLGSPRGERKLR